jgi:hypothetical protein
MIDRTPRSSYISFKSGLQVVQSADARQRVRAGDWKLAIVNGKTELHNLKTDLGEKSNVASEHPEIVEKLNKYMDEAHVPDPNWIPRPNAAAPLLRRILSGTAANAQGANCKASRTELPKRLRHTRDLTLAALKRSS